MLSLSDIAKELFAEKTRTILTILAIAWATFAIATMLAVGEGLRLNFAKTVANSGHNLLVITGGATTRAYQGIHQNTPINLNQTDLQNLSKLPNVAAISTQYNTFGSLKYKDQETNVQIQAVQENFAAIHQIPIAAPGRFINQSDLKERNAVIVLGTKSIEYLFPPGFNPIGKYVLFKGQPFLVIGVMQAKPQIVSSQGSDENYNWVPASTYELFANPTGIDSISVTYKDEKLIEDTKSMILKTIALNHKTNPEDTSIINFDDVAKMQKTINTFFLGMQIFLGIVGLLTLMVAGVGIANVMYASVSRATHEIGIRMAVGARSTQILVHYIAEALTATTIGGVLGIILTSLFVHAFQAIPMQGKLIDAIGKPKPVLSILVYVIVIVVLGITGFLAGLFPALKATKVDPSEALIYE
jgi:putative ABC transport system permease protein